MDALPLAKLVDATGGRWVEPGGNPTRPGRGPRRERLARRVCTDSRLLADDDLYVPLAGEHFNGEDFICEVASRASASLVAESSLDRVAGQLPESHGDFGLIVVDDALSALERLAAWYRRQLKARVIGLTGSFAKTTVKEFLGQILAREAETVRAPKSFNNRLGVSLTLLQARGSTRNVVVEIGTSAPGEIAHLTRQVAPDWALLTGIGPAHLRGLGDVDGVLREKAEIFAELPANGKAFLPWPLDGEAHVLDRLGKRDEGSVIRYSAVKAAHRGVDYRVTYLQPLDADVDSPGFGYRFEVNHTQSFELRLPGRHNVHNALAAIAVAREIGMDWETIAEAFDDLEPPPLRFHVETVGGVTVVDDTYNANPASFRSALDGAAELKKEGRWHLVLGDLRELGAASPELHAELGRDAAGREIFEKIWTVGEEARFAAESARAEGLSAESFGIEDLPALVDELGAELRQGDGVLFKASRAVRLERGARELKAALRGPVPGEDGRDLLSD